MKKKIIELLPSKSLKNKIIELNYQFTDAELLQIIKKYSRNLEEKALLLNEFSKTAPDNLVELVNAYIDFDKKMVKQFTEKNDEFVFELHIQELGGSDERYLCSSYSDCLKCIDLFYNHYIFANPNLAEYRITKRKIFSDGMDFEEDEYFECVLDNKKRIISISYYKDDNDCNLDNDCSECGEICPYRCDRLNFPCFVNYCGIVKYADNNKNQRYGVNLCYASGECGGVCDELFVVPLSLEYISSQDYENAIFVHQHIEPPLAEASAIEELDENLRKNYIAYVEYLRTKQSKN